MSLRDVAAQRKAERENGKLHGIAAVRAQKQEAREGGLSALRKQRSMSSKLDFTLDGIRYHNAHIHNKEERPYGTVSVSNGDMTFIFHNQYGSWMCNLDGHGLMAEPAKIARAMGTNATQLEVAMALTERYYAELKTQGVPTPEERIRQREEDARKQRRSNRNNTDDKE
jgi:hypothetical protein